MARCCPRPAVALVDDLSHSTSGAARLPMADAAELLAAGIDVISTVSIGQLESLSDVWRDHRRSHRTVPDPCPRPPWTWRRRRRKNGWHVGTSIRRSGPGRRWAAGSRPRTCPRCVSLPCCGWSASWPATGGGPAPAARFWVTVMPGSGWWSRSAAARRARRSSAGRHGSPPGLPGTCWPPPPPSSAALAAQRPLTVSLGGTYHQLADPDIPAALLAFAQAEDATQLVLGVTRRTRLTPPRLTTTIRSQLIRRGGGIGVHIVPCPPTATASCPQSVARIRVRIRAEAVTRRKISWPGRLGWQGDRAVSGQPRAGRHPQRISWLRGAYGSSDSC